MNEEVQEIEVSIETVESELNMLEAARSEVDSLLKLTKTQLLTVLGLFILQNILMIMSLSSTYYHVIYKDGPYTFLRLACDMVVVGVAAHVGQGFIKYYRRWKTTKMLNKSYSRLIAVLIELRDLLVQFDDKVEEDKDSAIEELAEPIGCKLVELHLARGDYYRTLEQGSKHLD
jgi:hypothetical protein